MKKIVILVVGLLTCLTGYSQQTVNQLYPCIDDNGNFVEGCIPVSIGSGRYIEAQIDTAICIGSDLEVRWTAVNSRLGATVGDIVHRDTFTNACSMASATPDTLQSFVSLVTYSILRDTVFLTDTITDGNGDVYAVSDTIVFPLDTIQSYSSTVATNLDTTFITSTLVDGQGDTHIKIDTLIAPADTLQQFNSAIAYGVNSDTTFIIDTLIDGNGDVYTHTDTLVTAEPAIMRDSINGVDQGAVFINRRDSSYLITNDTMSTPGGYALKLGLGDSTLVLQIDTLCSQDSIWRDSFFVYRGDTLAYYDYHRSAVTCEVDTIETLFCKDTIEGGYVSLRTIPGRYICDDFYLQDWTLIGPDGNIYDMLGGTFRKVSTGTENGGTVIVLANGTIVERQWDNIHLQPEWWEVGGYDHRGETYVDKNVASPLINLPSEKVFHSGIYNDNDRVASAFQSRNDEGKNIVVELLPDKEYQLDRQIELDQFASVVLSGNHATLKRADSPTSLLTVDVVPGATSFTVDDATMFRVGQRVTALDCNAVNGGLAAGEHAGVGLIVLGIVGNIITLTTPTTNAANILTGCPVIAVNHFFQHRSNNNEQVVWNNVIVDGNKLNGGLPQRFPQDWRLNNTALLGSGAFAKIENCKFFDTPAENITSAGSYMYKCEAYNLDGSLIHGSHNDGNYATAFNTGITVKDCRVNGVNLATDEIADHSESVVTSSLHTEFVKITNCSFQNGAEGILPLDIVQDDTKGYLSLINNTFVNFDYVTQSLGTGNVNQSEREDYLTITGNTFENCGEFIIWGHNLAQGLTYNGIVFADNELLNTRLDFRNVVNVKIQDNRFMYSDEGKFPFNILPQGELVTYAPLSLINVTSIDVENNYFENALSVNNDTISACINFNAHDCIAMKDAGGVDTDFYYEQMINISNNYMINFHTGITGLRRLGDNLGAFSNILQAVGWKFNNNYIALRDDNINPIFAEQRTWGIGAAQGVEVRGNTIVQTKNDVNQSLVFAHGHVIPGFGGNADKYPAASITQNNLYGFPGGAGNDVTVGKAVNQEWNIMVFDNVIVRPIGGFNNPLRNYVANNTQITTAILPGLTAPLPLQFHTFEENKGVY